LAFKKVPVEEGVGMVLGHDLTKIVPGEYKGPAFRKGHIVREQDIPNLKSIGKDHIYLIELDAGQIHENEAAIRMAKAVAGPNIALTEPSEGRVNLLAQCAGLLKVDREGVAAVNDVEYAVLSTRHGGTVVPAGAMLAGVKVVPLVVPEATVSAAEAIARNFSGGVVSVLPLHSLKTSIIITGNEVYYGRIADRFAPVLREKVAKYGGALHNVTYCPDDCGAIREAILAAAQGGAEVIIAAGGMSVDPDDVTPEAIKATGAAIVSYGSPVLPGAMFMLAYLGDVPVIGMPACGMYSRTTVLDLVYPRLLAGDRLSRRDISRMGYGGLCLGCAKCVFPHCPFGK